jgi:hypothetical protein
MFTGSVQSKKLTDNFPEKWLCSQLEFSQRHKFSRFSTRKSGYSMAQIVSIVKEAENARLKRMYADIVIQNELVKKT